MTEKSDTIKFYDKNADKLAKKFADFGVRSYDVKRAFSLTKKKNPKVVEVGCGAGRDAREMLKHTDKYLGIDLSEKMIKLAKKKVRKGEFRVCDLEKFKFPKNTDVIFALTSLLHSDIKEIKAVLRNAYRALNKKGIIYISLKYGTYQKITIEDKDGARTFYFYEPKDIIKSAGKRFKVVENRKHVFKDREFFILILQKK